MVKFRIGAAANARRASSALLHLCYMLTSGLLAKTTSHKLAMTPGTRRPCSSVVSLANMQSTDPNMNWSGLSPSARIKSNISTACIPHDRFVAWIRVGGSGCSAVEARSGAPGGQGWFRRPHLSMSEAKETKRPGRSGQGSVEQLADVGGAHGGLLLFPDVWKDGCLRRFTSMVEILNLNPTPLPSL